MAKQKTYYDYLREEMGELVDQLQLPGLQKQSLKRRWLDQVVWADKKADQCRRWHYRLRLTTIVGGITLPALVGINMQLAQDNPFFRTWFPYVPFALSQVIAVSAAAEEFFRYGDRWREYRKMSEDLKAEGWQYLQLTGPYQPQQPASVLVDELQAYRQKLAELNLAAWQPPQPESQPLKPTTHKTTYALFAGRIESIIQKDVQSYITAMQQQQAKENQQVQQLLGVANAAATDKTLFAPPAPVQAPGAIAPSDRPTPHGNRTGATPSPNGALPATLLTTPIATAPVALFHTTTTPGAAGILQVQQETQFKLSTQPSQSLPDTQKILVSHGSSFGLLACAPADRQHYQVTLTQGLGAEQRNVWYVYVPHVTLLNPNGQPAPAPTLPPPAAPVPIAAPLPPANPAPASLPQPAANLNAAILAAANHLRGTSSADGPDGGVNACAFMVNKVLQTAGIAPIGDNPKYVPDVVAALKQGRGKEVSRTDAKAGDLVIAYGDAHIGIGLTDGCTRVLSNSSSSHCFQWESDTDFTGSTIYGTSTIYRLLR